MTLHCRVVVERPSGFTVDVELTVGRGEVVALLGPNGAGKTTVLRAVAGLVPVTTGRIALDSNVWDEPPTLTPPDRRTCGVVFQDHLLFEHMTVAENVAFGPRSRGVRRRDALAAARDLLAEFGLADRADDRPRSLSGGQSQRVALARALATDPDVLLLDEPLSALDAATRMSVRSGLRRRLRGFAGRTIVVTHDPVDAMTLADRMVVLENGRIVQDGPPTEVAAAPRTDYVARLLGLNLLRGRARDGRVDVGAATLPVDAPTGPVRLTVPPSAVLIRRERTDGAWPVVVSGIERHADVVRLHLDGDPSITADLTARETAELMPEPDVRLWASVDPDRVGFA